MTRHGPLRLHTSVTGLRIALAALVALVTGLFLYGATDGGARIETDFAQPWIGAKLLLAGVDPYPLVGPGRVYEHNFPMIYPLTASAAVLPLGLLPITWAAVVFVAASSALLSYAITRDGFARLPLFLSAPFLVAVHQGQWSPVLSAAFLVPGLAWLAWAKPTIGLAMVAANGSLRTSAVAAAGGIILLLVTLAIAPRWPLEWFEALGTIQHMSLPVLRPGGFISLLALSRWRRPEARLVFLLSCVPQTPGWYEAVPLLLVPNTLRQSLAVALICSLPAGYEAAFGTADGLLDFTPAGWQMALFAYFPAVLLVLRRPNIAPAATQTALTQPSREVGAAPFA